MAVVGIMCFIALFMYLLVCGAAMQQDRDADDREQAEYLRKQGFTGSNSV